MRTIRKLGILGFVMVVALFTLPRHLFGCLEIPTPNPAAGVVYVLATGPTAEALANAIEECGHSGTWYPMPVIVVSCTISRASAESE